MLINKTIYYLNVSNKLDNKELLYRFTYQTIIIKLYSITITTRISMAAKWEIWHMTLNVSKWEHWMEKTIRCFLTNIEIEEKNRLQMEISQIFVRCMSFGALQWTCSFFPWNISPYYIVKIIRVWSTRNNVKQCALRSPCSIMFFAISQKSHSHKPNIIFFNDYDTILENTYVSLIRRKKAKIKLLE